jgi:3-methyladenine DNA glycosylase AlkD
VSRARRGIASPLTRTAFRTAVASVCDPAYASGAQRYMKSELPYLGVRMPDLRRSWRSVLVEHTLRSPEELDAAIRELWDEAEYREERYTALALVDRYPQWVTLELLERLIVEGAWWDYVDMLARRVGELLRRDPSVADAMRGWSTDADRWKRRVSIICQLGFKADTDLGLLYDCIEPNLADREFFVRKAVGWALRDYAWHDPDEVARYVDANEHRLSGLSRREATKNLAGLRANPERRRR